MLCEDYNNLSILERVQFIGKLCHAAQSDSKCFRIAEILISTAKEDGVLNGVTINPPKSLTEKQDDLLDDFIKNDKQTLI